MSFADELRNTEYKSIEQACREGELRGLYKELKQYCVGCVRNKGQSYAKGYLRDAHDWDACRDEDRFEAVEKYEFEDWPDRRELSPNEMYHLGSNREEEKRDQALYKFLPSADEIHRLTAKFTAHAQQLRLMLEKEGLQVHQLEVVQIPFVFQTRRGERKLFSTQYYKIKMVTNRVKDVAIRFHVSW